MGEEENRRSVGKSLGATETCFSQEKQITCWLNGDYPVIIMSMTHHARVMRVEAFVIVQKH